MMDLSCEQKDLCKSCGADPSVEPPSGSEPPIVRGALDAQAAAERRMFELQEERDDALAARDAAIVRMHEVHEENERLAARLALADRLLQARWNDGRSAYYALGGGIQITRSAQGGHFVSRSGPDGELAYLVAATREWSPVRFRREGEESAYTAWLDSIRFPDEFAALAALDERGGAR